MKLAIITIDKQLKETVSHFRCGYLRSNSEDISYSNTFSAGESYNICYMILIQSQFGLTVAQY